MARARSQFVCGQCGAASARWMGQCPSCQAWNTLQEVAAVDTSAARNRFAALAPTQTVQRLGTVQAAEVERIGSGVDEFDRVLGGGFVRGSVVLIGGDPGIGKSTLLLQSLALLARNHRVLYVSGEESATQVALRARRLGLSVDELPFLAEIALEHIASTIASSSPEVVVIDSVQTLYSAELQSAPGSVAQVRECAAHLTRISKQTGTTIIMVGHVTKEGTLAGPRVLEHMVDTVLYFEGDAQSSFRLVRAFKNRFGAVNELGVFAMTDRGLRGVSNPSALFLSRHISPVSGSSILGTLEGSRPLLVEIQALVDASHAPSPRRLSVGLETSRLAMLLAVIHRHAGLALHDQDVFVNAVGGVRISEPAADLAVALSVVSSLRGRPLPGGLCVFGEIGLAGEIRPAPRGQERLREIAKLGFSRAVIPSGNDPRRDIEGLQVVLVDRIDQAIAAAWEGEGR